MSSRRSNSIIAGTSTLSASEGRDICLRRKIDQRIGELDAFLPRCSKLSFGHWSTRVQVERKQSAFPLCQFHRDQQPLPDLKIKPAPADSVYKKTGDPNTKIRQISHRR